MDSRPGCDKVLPSAPLGSAAAARFSAIARLPSNRASSLGPSRPRIDSASRSAASSASSRVLTSAALRVTRALNRPCLSSYQLYSVSFDARACFAMPYNRGPVHADHFAACHAVRPLCRNPPHPPASSPLFGMAPFIAASVSAAFGWNTGKLSRCKRLIYIQSPWRVPLVLNKLNN